MQAISFYYLLYKKKKWSLIITAKCGCLKWKIANYEKNTIK